MNSPSLTNHPEGIYMRRGQGTIALAVAGAALLSASPALASGFAVARFGGPLGNPVSVNPTAVYYNPANLALINRTQAMIDINWAYRSGSYERPASAIDPTTGDDEPDYVAANTGTGEVSNFLYSPMIGVATDFNTDAPIGFGIALSAPFGGQAVWDANGVDDPNYPGAIDGAQRWYTIEGAIRTLAISAGFAYEIEPARLSIGISGNVYLSEVNTIRARNVDGSDSLYSEGRSRIDVSGTDFGIGAGLTWEAIEDTLFIAASYQSAPNFDGRTVLEGELSNSFTATPDVNDVTFTQRLPDIIRLGSRYAVNEDLELRLFGDITRWSNFTNQCIIETSILGDADPYEFCEIDENGDPPEGNSIVQNLDRQWKNAFGIRLGGSYFVNDRIELMLDLGYDGNAVPDETLEPALMDMPKISTGLGGMFRLAGRDDGFNLRLGTTLTNIFYFERDTTGVSTANAFRTTNSRQPSSEGIYNQNVLVLNTALYFGF